MTTLFELSLQRAAKELWDENPELRGQYKNDYQSFFQTYTFLSEWRDNPQLQQEFRGDFNLFVTYKRHEAAGDILR